MLAQNPSLNKFFLESSKNTRIAVSVSAVGFLLFLVVASLFPFKDQLFNILYPKPSSKAQEGDFITFTKQYFGSDGVLIASEEKKIQLTGESQAFINGERVEDLIPTTGPVIVDEREESGALKKYIVELDSKSLGEENLELKGKGVGDAERVEKVKSLKGTKAQERQTLKAEINKSLGKKLVKGNPKKDERRIFQEFDTSFHGFSIELLPNELDKVKSLKGVKRVVEDGIVKVTIDSSVPMIKAPDAWPLVDGKGAPLTGYGIKIGIIDTGVDYTHPDLGGCFDPGCKVEGGWDFINNDPNPMDDHGHGTHVAATAGGKGVLADGTKLYGVAPDATIYGYKVLDAGGSGSWSTVTAGIDRCLDPNLDGNLTDHLDVCSMSLGGPGTPDSPPSLASDNAMRNGVVMTIAAGNSGPGYQTIGSPGTSREAITVGAACKPEDIGRSSACSTNIASFSSRGPVKWVDTTGTAQEMIKPDIVSPGVNICAAEWGTWLSDRRCKDDKHIAIAGTSMATPHVAGMAALLRQAAPQATPADIKTAIKARAVPYSGFDENTQGKGLINTIESLKYLSPNLDFSSNLYATPYSWPVITDISQATYSTSQSFTITNTTASETTATVSAQNLPAGVTIIPDKPSLTIPGNGTATFTATLTADYSVLASGQTYLAQLLVSSSVKQLYIAVTITAPNRLSVAKNVDFGVDSPDLSGTWTSTKDFQLTNLQNVSGTYSLTTDCCYGPNGKVTSGISVSLPASTALSPNESKTLSATASVDNNTIPNGSYSGQILISSPLQNTLRIPFSITKYYRLTITYPATSYPKNIGFHNQASLEQMSYVAAGSGSITYLLTQKYPVLDVVGIFTDYGENPIQTYVVKENLAFSGDNTVAIDPAEATLEITPFYTGIDGEPLGQYGSTSFARQLPALKFKKNGFPSSLGGFGNFGALRVKVNPISSNYLLSLAAHYKYPSTADINTMVNFEHVLANGISSSVNLTNTKDNLRLIPVFGYPPSGESSVAIRLAQCASSILAQTACYTDTGMSAQAASNYRLDLYALPIETPPDFGVMVYQSVEIRLGNSLNIIGEKTALAFDKTGIKKWINSPIITFVGPETEVAPSFSQPAEFLPITNTNRLDLGILPYNFQTFWLIRPDTYYIGNLNGLGGGLRDQDWNSIRFTNANILKYQVVRDGNLIREAIYDPAGSVYLTDAIGNLPGNYEIKILGNTIINGVTTTHSYKSSFNLPAGFSSSDDREAPITRNFSFLSGGMPAQVVDSTRSPHTMKFTLDPLGGTISSVVLRLKTDIADWQDLTLNQDSTTEEYSASVSVITDANLYTFELTATDNSNNVLTYSFQLPKGTVPGGGGGVPTPSPSPTPTPTPTPPPDTTPPTAPTNLKANPVSSSQINLAWNPSSDNVAVVGYEVYRDGVKIATAATTSYGDANLTPSTTYSYYVVALDQAGNVSPSSNTVSVATQPAQTYGSILGTVYSSAGGIVPGTKITIRVGNSNKIYYSNSLGIYSIPNLPPGTYSLTFQAKGYVNQRISVTVTANNTTTRDVTMIKR